MKKPNKIILFDIDYTLFDTDLYREKFFPLLAIELGITDTSKFTLLRKAASEKARKDTGFFHPKIFLKELKKHAQNPTSLKKLENIFFKNESYKTSLYEDALTILDELALNKNYLIGILSTGHKKHQGKKIERLKNYFQKKHIHIFPNKIHVLNEVLEKYKDYSDIYLIDDLQEVLKAAKEINKNVQTIWLKRTKKYEETHSEIDIFKPDYTFTNLSDILSVLKK